MTEFCAEEFFLKITHHRRIRCMFGERGLNFGGVRCSCDRLGGMVAVVRRVAFKDKY